jgi:hypothetical protein
VGVIGETAHHVLNIAQGIAAAHIGRERELEATVQAGRRLEHLRRTADVVGLTQPAGHVQSESVDADGLYLLDLALVGAIFASPAGSVSP